MPAPAWSDSERFLLRALSGDRTWTDLPAAAVLEEATFHGVSPLVFRSARDTPEWSDWPPALRGALADAARRGAAIELADRNELAGVLDALATGGIEVLILKGGALAHTLYPEPWLRPRGDTDLLVRPEQRAAVFEELARRGYRRAESAGGEVASSETSFAKAGAARPLDVHWRVNNSPLLSPLFRFGELRARAQPLPALGPHALGLGLVEAVLLAAIHRATHHRMPVYVGERARRGDRLIWLHDLHLLLPQLDGTQADELAQRATDGRVAGLCLEALTATQAAFGTTVPLRLREALERAAARHEPSMAFLRGGRRRLLVAELRAVPGWRERARWLREHVAPPPDYMLRKYGTQRRWLLPALYVRRAFGWLAR